MKAEPRSIPNTQLRPGMTVIKQVGGTWKVDAKLKKHFVTSPRFPDIAFETNTHPAVFSRCGRSYVIFD